MKEAMCGKPEIAGAFLLGKKFEGDGHAQRGSFTMSTTI
jgi:hypothetical protein